MELGSRHRGKIVVKKMTKQYDGAFDFALKCIGDKKVNQPIPSPFYEDEDGNKIPKKEGLLDAENK